MHDSDILPVKVGIPDKNILFATLFLITKYFWSKVSKILGAKKSLVPKNLRSQKLGVWKIWARIFIEILVWINLFSERFLFQNFEFKIRKYLGLRNFGFKNILGPRKFRRICLDQKPLDAFIYIPYTLHTPLGHLLNASWIPHRHPAPWRLLPDTFYTSLTLTVLHHLNYILQTPTRHTSDIH